MSLIPFAGRRSHQIRRSRLSLLALTAMALPAALGTGTAQAADPSIASLDVLNTATGLPVTGLSPLPDGAAVNLGALPSRSLSITATTSPALTGSVVFVLDGTKLPVESVAPYAIFGDKDGKYLPWTPTVGTHTLTATAYPQAGAAGTPGTTVTRTFIVTDTQTPWSAPATLPGTIEAEDFDRGGEGIAYHDFDPLNQNGLYRPTEGVDIVSSTERSGALAVGHLRVGDWMEYTVDVAKTGVYDLGVRFATGTDGGKVHVEIDGKDVSGTVNLSSTDGYQNWTTTWIPKVTLAAGKGQILRFVVDATNEATEIGNLGSIEVRDTEAPETFAWPTAWRASSQAPEKRFEAAYQSIFGRIYAFGGFADSQFHVSKTFSMYSVSTGTWKAMGPMPARLAETHAGITNDGTYIYLAGGFSGDLRDTRPTQDVSNALWRYDPLANAWLQIGKLPQSRGAGSLVYSFGKLHYFGGNPADRFTNLGTHWVFDLARKVWSIAAPMPDPKDHFSTATLGTRIYAIGGEHGHDVLFDAQTTVHYYDVLTDKWTQVASLPSIKSHMEGSTFTADGRIFVAGGQIDGQRSSKQIFVYNPSTNQWSILPFDLPYPRQGAYVQRIGSQIAVGLGAEFTSQPSADTWLGRLPETP